MPLAVCASGRGTNKLRGRVYVLGIMKWRVSGWRSSVQGIFAGIVARIDILSMT